MYGAQERGRRQKPGIEKLNTSFLPSSGAPEGVIGICEIMPHCGGGAAGKAGAPPYPLMCSEHLTIVKKYSRKT